MNKKIFKDINLTCIFQNRNVDKDGRHVVVSGMLSPTVPMFRPCVNPAGLFTVTELYSRWGCSFYVDDVGNTALAVMVETLVVAGMRQDSCRFRPECA